MSIQNRKLTDFILKAGPFEARHRFQWAWTSLPPRQAIRWFDQAWM